MVETLGGAAIRYLTVSCDSGDAVGKSIEL